ncbi:MAG: TIM barrel protein [Actinobacteria bacterium]|nr:TIM barrel protein [Actinomycetota bacterium]
MIFNKFNADMGIVSFMAYPEMTKDENIYLKKIRSIASDEFFSFIEVCHIEDQKIRQEVKNILEISNIRVGFDAHTVILPNNLSINSSKDEERERVVKILKSLIDEAYYLNAEGFTLLSGLKPEKGNMELELKKAIESVKELCSYSLLKANELQARPVDVVIETFDDREYAKNRLIGPTGVAVNLAKEIKKDFDNFGLLLDLSHIPILEENFIESLNLAKDFIKHIHIGNCILKDKSHPAFGDNHPRFGIQNGENDIKILADFIKALINIGYLKKPGNTIIFEVKPLSGEDPEITVAGSKRAFLRALNLV